MAQDDRSGGGTGTASQGRERAAPRHKTFVPTRLTTARGEQRAHVLNLSRTGALLHAEPAPGRGHRVSVQIGAHAVEALVAWSEGARFGVSFQHPIDDDAIATLLG